MPSQLTRVVFRSIIANRPLVYRGCIYRAPRLQIPPPNAFPSLAPATQRRTFFNMLKTQRKAKAKELHPGFETMSETVHFQRTGERLPETADVLKAFNAFFSQKQTKFEDFYIEVAIGVFVFLEKHPRDGGEPWLSTEDVRRALASLQYQPETGGKPHLQFARILIARLMPREEKIQENMRKSESPAPSAFGQFETSDLPLFIKLLCIYGAAAEARSVAERVYGGSNIDTRSPIERQVITLAWENVLRGFVVQDHSEELKKTVDMMRELDIPFTLTMQAILVDYFSAQKDSEQAKHWYLEPAVNTVDFTTAKPQGKTYAAILTLCASSGDTQFGQQIMVDMLKERPGKDAWDAIFLWSAGIGKGVDEVDRMMSVMVRRNDEARQKNPEIQEILRPDIRTINKLVAFSMSKNDPYSAERYITLGNKWAIVPNAETFTLQMQYRLSVKDIDGARAAYFGLQGEPQRANEQSTDVINKLVQAMCASNNHYHFDDIMAVVDDMHENKVLFDPSTVATLCILHLQRGEQIDAIDLVQVHAHRYSPQQRLVISTRLVDFMLDRRNSTADAWDAYSMIRQLFPETPRDVREKMMTEFFQRRRSDMACHVFFHIRNHGTDYVTATQDTYAAAFAGFGAAADEESLELIHNQLKLDLNTELNTKIRNALMIAYTGVGNPTKALEFWYEIAASQEGPSYNSIAIAFRALEFMPWGDEHAKRIWNKLKQMDIDIDKQIFTAYMCSLAGNSFHDEACKLVENVEQEYRFKPDIYILSNWFNATRNLEDQENVEAWIREYYPEVWVKLTELGHVVAEDEYGVSYKQFKIDRQLDP
ncbi:hypothetical protein P154DRAFT_452853 [Amniculicola lignicola CBS 123094]|uniref:Complex I intermediate-associated protein-like protein 84 n=1 Tax=Amniculicola lignicola CBS 123094 TaxID=1392246 RepID=A0A6A5X455_9PLEO|nr:hypothetical protein P154DRAFT_452853 [Amniculicola lignicola CBS 123094]